MFTRGVLRVDAGPSIGMGHAMRCLAMAHVLTPVCNLVLATKSMPDLIESQFQSLGVEVLRLKVVERLQDVDQIMSGYPDLQFIVMDGYTFDADYQREFAKQDLKVVVLDDLIIKDFSADVVINHSPAVCPDDYQVEVKTKLCLGLDYAVLNPVFLDVRKIEVSRQNKQVLICMGGVDPKNYTARIILALSVIKQIEVIDVVIGGQNENFQEIMASIQNLTQVKVNIHRSLEPKKMALLLRKSAIAISTASTIALEACATATPLIVGWAVDNQKSIYDGFVNNGLALGIGNLNALNEKNARMVVAELFDNEFCNELIEKQNIAINGETARHLRECVLRV